MITRKKMGIHWPQDIILRERRENCEAFADSAYMPSFPQHKLLEDVSMMQKSISHIQLSPLWPVQTPVMWRVTLSGCGIVIQIPQYFRLSPFGHANQNAIFRIFSSHHQDFSLILLPPPGNFFLIALEFMGNTTFGKRSVNLHISL